MKSCQNRNDKIHHIIPVSDSEKWKRRNLGLTHLIRSADDGPPPSQCTPRRGIVIQRTPTPTCRSGSKKKPSHGVVFFFPPPLLFYGRWVECSPVYFPAVCPEVSHKFTYMAVYVTIQSPKRRVSQPYVGIRLHCQLRVQVPREGAAVRSTSR